MSEKEYYEALESATANYDCDRCQYGICGECHLQCNKSFDDYERELNNWLSHF